MVARTAARSAAVLLCMIACASGCSFASDAKVLPGRSVSDAHCRGELLEARAKLRVHESCCSQLDAVRSAEAGLAAAGVEAATDDATADGTVWQGAARARIAALTAELLAQERALAETRASQGDMNQRLVR